MSDDMWRERRDRDDFSEYGSLFDDAEPTQNIDEVRGKKAGQGEQGVRGDHVRRQRHRQPPALDRSAHG